MFNRFDIVEAWYCYLSEYHGGQFSREYRRLCKMLRYFQPAHNLSSDTLSDDARAIYDGIVADRGGK
jgi:hypothetical protein